MFLTGRSRIFSSSDCQAFGGNTDRHGSIKRVTLTRPPRAARNLGGIPPRPFSSRAYSASPLSIRFRSHPAPHYSLLASTFLHNFPYSCTRRAKHEKKSDPPEGPDLTERMFGRDGSRSISPLQTLEPPGVPFDGERCGIALARGQGPERPARRLLGVTRGPQERRRLTGNERHVKPIQREREALPHGLDVGFLPRPAGEERVRLRRHREGTEYLNLPRRKEVLGNALLSDRGLDRFEIDADLSAARDRVQDESAGGGHVEAESHPTELRREGRFPAAPVIELQPARIYRQVPPKDGPQPPATGDETVTVPPKRESVRSSPFAHGEGLTQAFTRRGGGVRGRAPDVNLIVLEGKVPRGWEPPLAQRPDRHAPFAHVGRATGRRPRAPPTRRFAHGVAAARSRSTHAPNHAPG